MIRFFKAHGLGNDFLILSQLPSHEQILKLADRHTGIGFDQLLWVGQSQEAKRAECDFEMRVFDADGTEAEMCGNGIRAAALSIAHEKRMAQVGTHYRVLTLAGIKSVWVRGLNEQFTHGQFEVDMGEVTDLGDHAISVKSNPQLFSLHCLLVGNPHAVCWGTEVLDDHFKQWSLPLISHLELKKIFNSGATGHTEFTNLEWAEHVASNRIKVRVWERGVGPTLACGTGATAVAFSAWKKGLIPKSESAIIEFERGTLVFTQNAGPHGTTLRMNGPAELIAEGTLYL